MKYTIEQNGTKWVASNGTDHIEADDPGEAIMQLLIGEEGAASVGQGDVGGEVERVRADDVQDMVGASCVRLIRSMARTTPAWMIREEIRVLGSHVERWISLSNLE